MENEKYSVPLDLKNVNITDGFWGREQELVRREVIPYQWDALNDEVPDAAPSYCMRNFRVAGRMMSKKREEGAFNCRRIRKIPIRTSSTASYFRTAILPSGSRRWGIP